MALMSLLELGLRGFLFYAVYVRPVIYGAQLCKKESPDARQVANVTLALIFNWLLELADMAFLSSFIAAHNVYVVARIVLALYFAHPTFLGALGVYEKVCAPLVEAYGPMVDSMFMQHMDTIAQSGLVHYTTKVGMSLFHIVFEVVDIAKRLMDASADTEVPAAPLKRRLSVGRAEPVYEERDRKDAGGHLNAQGERPEEQYVTPSVVAKVRRTASERGYLTPTPNSPPPAPLPTRGFVEAEDVTFEFSGDVRAQPVRRPPMHPPPSPPPPPQRFRNPFESDEEDYGEETQSGQSTPPPAVTRRGRSDTYRHDNLYSGSDYGY